MAHILIFGTSTTYGAWDTEGGWFGRLRKYIDERVVASYDGQNHSYYHVVYNLGISGDDSRGILARFEQESKIRLDEDGETIVIFHVGVNDAQFRHKENQFKVPPEEYVSNLEKLVSLSKNISSKIIFMGLNPVEDKRVDPIPWNLNESYKTENAKKYDGLLKKVCKEQNVNYIEIFSKFTHPEKLLEDGLHPNNEGHKIIFEAVRDYLTENKII